MRESLIAVDQYWRAANYLTVASMYLEKNLFLARPLSADDVKPYTSGHWGTCPGINFLYAHINRYIIEHKRETQLILGLGHGGNALMANIMLEGSLDNVGKQEQDVRKPRNPYQDFIKSHLRTEVNPTYEGTIYDGGELGYSLPVAFGSVLDAPGRLCVCIIGDGEAETGTISASWSTKDCLDRSSGFVLPILHLNGLRMGGPSLAATRTNDELISIFRGLGYQPKVVGADHEEMYRALLWVEEQYTQIEDGKHNQWPMLIFRSPKGWTAPDTDDFHIQGRMCAHKNPLHDLMSGRTCEYLEFWLKSYLPNVLFEKDGMPKQGVLSNIPPKGRRLGESTNRYHSCEIRLPDAATHRLGDEVMTRPFANVTALQNYLADVLRLNPQTFRVVSPDELQSNSLGELKTITVSGWSDSEKENGRVMEILNENICQAWMQGYTLTGRCSLMIGYEAFMPIISSMVSQYAKWLYQSSIVNWREPPSSLTYLLTSVCWANTYSHQNPEFINALLGLQHSFMRVYFPPDANSLLACMEVSLASKGRINTIVSTKQKMRQWLEFDTAMKGVKSGVLHWDWLSEPVEGEPDLVLVAAGDYPVRECLEAMLILRERIVGIHIRFLSVMELTSIGSTKIYPHAMSNDEFVRLFTIKAPIVFDFHGYVSAIEMLLFNRLDHQRLSILGYNNKSYTSADDLTKMILNGCSRYHVALEAIKHLHRVGRVTSQFFCKEKEALLDTIQLSLSKNDD